MQKAAVVQALRDVVIPIVGAVIPFGSTLVDKLTEPDTQFVYGVTYGKNPASTFAQFADKLGSLVDDEKVALEVKSKIAPKYMEAMNLKPFDTRSATVLNLTGHELRNLRFFFSDCVGIHSYGTFPEPVADQKVQDGVNPLIVKYDRVPATDARRPGYASGTATVWAKDASTCSVIVTAELPDGKPAAGGPVTDLNAYTTQLAALHQEREKKFDFTFKALMSILIAYMLFKVRKL